MPVLETHTSRTVIQSWAYDWESEFTVDTNMLVGSQFGFLVDCVK